MNPKWLLVDDLSQPPVTIMVQYLAPFSDHRIVFQDYARAGEFLHIGTATLRQYLQRGTITRLCPTAVPFRQCLAEIRRLRRDELETFDRARYTAVPHLYSLTE